MLRPLDLLVIGVALVLGIVCLAIAALIRRELARSERMLQKFLPTYPLAPRSSRAASRAASSAPAASPAPQRPSPVAPKPVEHAPFGDGGLDDSYDTPAS